MILGVIADDFTGATDVAGMLVRAGMRTVQVIGVPSGAAPDADAVVVALKSRTVPADEAVARSLAALEWLQAAGARQIYFKYCSTFDSTPRGNIGPVAEALMARLGTDFAIACPAFPENGRTVFRGHLFVGDALLSDSGMRDHPLTPMTDANLVRVLQAQCRGRVGLVRHDTVAQGAQAIIQRFDALRGEGVRLAIVDAVRNDDLLAIGEACAQMPLVAAGSGVAMGLPPAWARRGWLRPDAQAARLDAVGGQGAVLSGSCSEATRAQVRHWIEQGRPALRIDPSRLLESDRTAGPVGTASATDAMNAARTLDPADAVDATGAMTTAAVGAIVDEALAWAQARLADGPVLIYSTAAPTDVRAVQDELGAERAGLLVERTLAGIARGLVERDVRRLVVAGGETSGAVVQVLGVAQLRIGAAIDPGVPWTQADGRPLLLALKSGNFGAVDFFSRALAQAR